MNITIFGWAMAVMIITAGIVFAIGRNYTTGIVLFLAGISLVYIGFKDKDVKSEESA